MINSTPASPADPAAERVTLQPKELLGLLADLEDRAPLELIDACAAHGEAMVEVLRGAIDYEYTWSDEVPDRWWVPLHAAFILGRIPTESGGLLLVHLLRSLDEHDEEDLQDWLAGFWPALFANKPPGAIEAARELAEDRSVDWYIRCQGVDVVLDAGRRESGEALENAIDWAAALARDESDEWPFRMSAASDVLDFPRPRHRAWLETMARDEARHQAAFGDPVGMFDVNDVESAFARASDEPEWFRRGDPWKFYAPDEIAARQQRWQEEDDMDRDAPVPYVRIAPKIGRNDPCPCGSGKKYKRCCLAKDEAIARHAGDVFD